MCDSSSLPTAHVEALSYTKKEGGSFPGVHGSMPESGCALEEGESAQTRHHHRLWWAAGPWPCQPHLPLLEQLLSLGHEDVFLLQLRNAAVPTGTEITKGMFHRQEPSAGTKPLRMENTFGAAVGDW